MAYTEPSLKLCEPTIQIYKIVFVQKFLQKKLRYKT